MADFLSLIVSAYQINDIASGRRCIGATNRFSLTDDDIHTCHKSNRDFRVTSETINNNPYREYLGEHLRYAVVNVSNAR